MMQAVEQDDKGATYAAKIDKAEARVDWSRSAVDLDRHIRGLSPFPGAWCLANGERVKLLQCRLSVGAGLPGKIIAGLTVACGDGAIELLRVQKAGKGPVSADAFLNGSDLDTGDFLS